jgi:SET domain-containing protein
MSKIDCVTCKATKKDGQRCTRKTCKYVEMCWQHTKKEKSLVVKKSSIKGAGDGLYTTKEIKKGDKVASYTGEKKTRQEYDQNISGYGVEITKQMILDARSTQTGLGRYVNDCRAANKRRGECKGNNARFTVDRKSDSVSVKATKRIKAGEEVFLSYGRKYWA